MIAPTALGPSSAAARRGVVRARVAHALILALALGCTGPAHSTDGGASPPPRSKPAGLTDGTSCRNDGECASGFCRCASACRSGCCAPEAKRQDTMCTMDCRDLRCPNP